MRIDDINIETRKIDVVNSIELSIRREDRIHPFISGNKYRKLKYNIQEAKQLNKSTLLTFGGAYSNHIAAVAYAGKVSGIKTIGVIRGEELIQKVDQNPTLRFAKHCGMEFYCVSRVAYRQKTTDRYVNSLKDRFGDFYLIPEGGTNALAIKGCEEILNEQDKQYDFVCCCVGTGGTISGIVNSSGLHQKVLGFSALKGDFLKDEISKFAIQENWQLITDYHFGGYAKINAELITFINSFRKRYNVPLDPVYTGKMMFGITDMIRTGYFPKKSKVLAIHTGGLQGIEGMNEVLKKKNLPLIEVE